MRLLKRFDFGKMTFNPQKTNGRRKLLRTEFPLLWHDSIRLWWPHFPFAHSLFLSSIFIVVAHIYTIISQWFRNFHSFIFLLRWADAIFVVKYFKWFFFWLNDLHTSHIVPFIHIYAHWKQLLGFRTVRVLCGKCHSHALLFSSLFFFFYFCLLPFYSLPRPLNKCAIELY